ncbi:MAG: elongation factor G [Pirellulaceae bacterium]
MTKIERVRNIGISAHIDSGKTTLTERMLYYCGRIHEIHDVRGADGVGATMDSDPIERKRGITISSAVTSVDWKDHVFQIIDTPGHVDFTVEVERSLRVLDGAILVLCSVGGVQSQSYTVDKQMRRYGVPRIAFINKMDRVGADPQRVIQEMRERLRTNAIALQLPIGGADNFVGVVDLVAMHAVTFDGELGQVVRREQVPVELQAAATRARSEMLEAIALVDEALMETLLTEGEPNVEEIRQAIRRATLAHLMTPVLMGSAGKNCAVQELLDGVAFYLPAPTDRQVWAHDLCQPVAGGETAPTIGLTSDKADPTVAMAFKTIVEDFGPVTYIRVYQGQIEKGQTYVNSRTGKRHRFPKLVRMHASRRTEIDVAEAGDLCGVIGLNSVLGDTYVADGYRVTLESIVVAEPVLQLSIEPQGREDSDRLVKALERFRRQDPTFRYWTDAESGQMLIAGMGQLHLDVYIQRLRDDHNCEVHVGRPQVAYKERPTRAVPFEYRFKKQNGGQGLLAHIVGRLEPLPVDSEAEFEFRDEVSGGRISRAYIPAIREGVVESLSAGLLGNYPIVGVRLVLLDGLEHEKDSSDLAFHRCAWEAMREEVLPRAELELLEPMIRLEVEVPSEFQGSVVGNLTRKRANLSASHELEGTCRIEAQVPLAEMLDYANEIRSLTQGKGTFTMTPNGYESMPQRIAELVLQSDSKRKVSIG